jgi:hypothetical protein
MKKFRELFTESVWSQTHKHAMVKNYRTGILAVIADKGDYRADIQDKQGAVKKMGDQYNDLDEFIDYLADEFGMDWRKKDADLLDWLEGIG